MKKLMTDACKRNWKAARLTDAALIARSLATIRRSKAALERAELVIRAAEMWLGTQRPVAAAQGR
jgi:hypothetical protein